MIGAHQAPGAEVDDAGTSPADDVASHLGPGIYDDLPFADYLTHQGSLSSTQLKRLTKSPAHFKGAEDPDTDALRLGRLTHAVLLEGGAGFVVSPFESFRTKEARAWRDEQEATGVAVVTEDQMAHAKAMAQAVRSDPDSAPLFTDGKPEVSLFWEHQATGIMLRARYDWMRFPVEGRRLLIPDLKTTTDAAPWEFDSSVGKFGYYQSAAHYCDGAKALGLDPDPVMVLVAVEKSKPHVVQTYVIDEDDLRLGRELNERAIRLYARCLETDTWPKYRQGVSRLSLRPYHAIPAQEILHDHDD